MGANSPALGGWGRSGWDRGGYGTEVAGTDVSKKSVLGYWLSNPIFSNISLGASCLSKKYHLPDHICIKNITF